MSSVRRAPSHLQGDEEGKRDLEEETHDDTDTQSKIEGELKYMPVPVEEKVNVSGIEDTALKWDVQYEADGGGYLFSDQDTAMIFCLLLEIRDLLKSEESSEENDVKTKVARAELRKLKEDQ